MALFPRLFAQEFTPMIRLADDFACHAASRGGLFHPAFTTTRRTFQPRFDVRESQESYELHGELPGINQKDIDIEFVDPQTLSIKGRTESRREESSRQNPTSETVATSATTETTQEDDSSIAYRKPSVEDEAVLVNADGSSSNITENAPEQTPSQPQEQDAVSKVSRSQRGPHYWLSERSVGQFSRTFAFPSRINQDEVKASLKDGILSIVVPKAAPHVLRRINIE